MSDFITDLISHFIEKHKITQNWVSARKSSTCGYHTRKTELYGRGNSIHLEIVPCFWQHRNLPQENWSLCEYRVQLSQGRPNYHLVMIMRKKRFHRLNEAKHLSGSNFLQLHLYSPRSAVSSSVRAPFHPKHTYAVPKMSEASFQHT